MSRIVLAVLLAAAAASAQWTEPVPVPYESTWQHYNFVVAPGDTLWSLWTSGKMGWDSAVAYASWSLGDSWSEPESIGQSHYSESATAGCDGEGRPWILWYDGIVPWDGCYTMTVQAGVRDAGGWRHVGSVLRSPGPDWDFARGLCVARTRGGRTCVGMIEHVHEGSGQYNSARFSWLQGDTLTWPQIVVKGDTSPNDKWVDGPLLAPRPDSGLWAVSTVLELGYGSDIAVHAIQGDTAMELLEFPGWHEDAVADSAGRLRVFYLNGGDTLWLATVDTDLHVEHELVAAAVRPYSVSACVDPEGWLWCLRPGPDSNMVVSYNRGHGWSEPEVVAESVSERNHLLTDAQGRVYVLHSSRYTAGWRSRYRTARPGVEERDEGGGMRAEYRVPTVMRAADLARVEGRLFDMMGREVTDRRQRLVAGVYFVRAVVDGGRGASSVTKVVVTE